MRMVLTLSLLSSVSVVTIVCTLIYKKSTTRQTYMNNTFVHLAVILMHSLAAAASGDYQRFSAFFIIVGKNTLTAQ